MALNRGRLSVLLVWLFVSSLPGPAYTEIGSDELTRSDPRESADLSPPNGDFMPTRFALPCRRVGGRGRNVTVLADYRNGGTLKKIHVVAGRSTIKGIRGVLTTGEVMVFGNITTCKAAKIVAASFTFERGERITELLMWTNGRKRKYAALGAIEFTTNSGRRFEIGRANRTGQEPTVVKDEAVGAGFVTALKAASDSKIVTLCFQFLRPITNASIIIDRYPGLVGKKARGERRVLGDAEYKNPTEATQHVSFSGAPTVRIEHNWTNALGLKFKVDVETVSAPAPVLDQTEGEAKWSLDDRKDWPMHYSGGEQPSYNYSVSVPPGSKVYSKMVKTEYGIQTGYEGLAILQTGKDRRWNFTITGEYSGKISKVEERIGDED